MTKVNASGNQIELDVLKRQPPQLSPDSETASAVKSDQPLSDQLIKAGENNARAVVDDVVHVGADVVNIGVGGAQVVGGLLGALKDLGDAAGARMTAGDLAISLDSEQQLLAKKGELSAHDQLRVEKLGIAAANMREVKESDWPRVKEGVQRMVTGAAYTAFDLASLPIDAAQAVLTTAAGLGIKAGKAAVSFGKRVGSTVMKIFRAIKDFFVKVGKGIWDGAKAVGGAIAGVIFKAGDGVREGYEDSVTWIAKGAAAEANRVADNGPRLKLQVLDDY